jgi:hypothetical protein
LKGTPFPARGPSPPTPLPSVAMRGRGVTTTNVRRQWQRFGDRGIELQLPCTRTRPLGRAVHYPQIRQVMARVATDATSRLGRTCRGRSCAGPPALRAYPVTQTDQRRHNRRWPDVVVPGHRLGEPTKVRPSGAGRHETGPYGRRRGALCPRGHDGYGLDGLVGNWLHGRRGLGGEGPIPAPSLPCSVISIRQAMRGHHEFARPGRAYQ